MKKNKTMRERLETIERREGMTGNEIARCLGVTSSDYHNKLKNDRPPTTAWRIALQFMDEFGVGKIKF